MRDGSARRANGYTLSFRPDIEGIRALAVVLVVAAHAGVPLVRGGFIGVDVFFVLSGYLITGLLCREVQASGTIALRAFYARRLQRLLPALLAMVVVTAVASALLLAPFEHPPQAAAALAAASWLSNFYFAFARVDYFGADAESNAFLHTWSLGVEEQFYLAWPLLLLFCLGVLRRRSRRLDWPQLWQGLVATFAISLVLSLVMTSQAPALAFYMAPARAWQFALGAVALLAGRFVGTRRRRPGLDRLPWAPLAWIGLALMLAAAIVFDETVPYPGWRALLPSIGAALVLAAGQYAPHNRCTVLLSGRPFVAIGRLSYSWYLWHWPTLVLGQTVMGESAKARMMLVTVSLALAWITKHLVESPIRRSRRLRMQPACVLLAACVAIATMGLATMQWRGAIEEWSKYDEQAKSYAARLDGPIIYARECEGALRSSRVHACFWGFDAAPRTAVLLGDSVAAQWFSAMHTHFRSDEWRLLVLTKSACPLVDAPFFYERVGRRYTECEEWRAQALAYLDELKPEVVVMGSSASYPFSTDEWRDGSQRVFKRVSATAKHTYLLQPLPTLGFDAPTCVARQAWRNRQLPALGEACSQIRPDGGVRDVKMALAAAASAASVVSIDLTSAVCPGGTCRAQQDGITTYRDSQHLSDTFVRSLQPQFDAALNQTERR